MDNQNNLKEIERKYQSASGLDFYGTEDYQTKPSVISLIFDLDVFKNERPDLVYNELFNFFKSGQCTIALRKEKDLIHLSLIDRETANSVNCYNLRYQNRQLDEFISQTEKDWGFAFVIGFYTEGDVIGMPQLSGFLVCRGYSISEEPS